MEDVSSVVNSKNEKFLFDACCNVMLLGGMHPAFI